MDPVYPAAGFVQTANQSGAHTLEINLEPSAVESSFDAHVYGKASEALPQFVKEFLSWVVGRKIIGGRPH